MIKVTKKKNKKTKKLKKMADQTINAIGKKCPMPVLMTKKELRKLSTGQVLEVLADDVGAKKDIPALLGKTGDKLVEVQEDGSKLTFIIKKA